jgi:hypothetical protein
MGTTDDQQRDQKQVAGFRRAVWLQVYLPLILGAILVTALIAFALVASGRGGGTTSGMADVALVALLLPVMLLGVLALGAIILLSVGAARLIGWIPDRSRIVQKIAAQASQQSDRIAGRAAQVIVVPKSAWRALGVLRARRTGKD